MKIDYRLDETHPPEVLGRCFDSPGPWTAQVLLSGGALVERQPAPRTTLEHLADACESVTIRAGDGITLDQVLAYVLAAIAPLADPLPDPLAGDVVRYRQGSTDVALLLFHRRMP